MPCIDSHHHFWRFDPSEYGWISESMEVLQRDFLPADLQEKMRAAGVDGAVSVQARQTLEETEWLLSLAAQHSFLRGVVGWLPLAADDFPRYLDRFSSHPKLKGLRHIVQDEPDENYILGTDFNRGIALLKNTSLVYDVLIFERHLPQAIQFVDRHPQQVFVLDHVAKPLIRQRQIDPWRQRIHELARRENVYCKVSGMVTEADWQTWSPDDLQPYFEVVLEAFGAARLMVGSDWPVCLLASTYSRWFEIVRAWVSLLSSTEQRRILGETARAVYRLDI